MEAAASDLNSYYKATEWAMLHFHKEKMREINAIIRELWRQIYRGSDIDYIEIKTDVPEQTCKFYDYCTCALESDMSSRPIQTLFLKINFHIVSQLFLGLSSELFLTGFVTKMLYGYFSLSHIYSLPFFSYSSWFDHFKNALRREIFLNFPWNYARDAEYDEIENSHFVIWCSGYWLLVMVWESKR